MYRTVTQINSAIEILSTWFPDFFTRFELPEPSVQGRTVYALRLRAGTGTGRRGVLVVGGTHARELMNPDAIIDLAIDLFLSYANGTGIAYGNCKWTAQEVRLIVESLDVWLVPCSNPDGREYVMTVDDLWRKNRRDNPGTTCDGVDLNRNSDVLWGVAQGQTSCSPCSEVYAGPAAFSEPETRNIKYLLDTERMVCFVDVHSYSELVLYPWGHAPVQSTDPSKRFTGLPTGTCTASVPAGYAEYMPPIDLQRFTTVAQRIVNDIAAVRGRHYTPKTSFQLYPTTGTQGDYAYARHVANPSLYKTYGFTFETGPAAETIRDSFHPPDPSLIQRDTKAAILSLLRESVCAIELIGLNLFGEGSTINALRAVRDDLLATTAAGREWVALYERVQFPLVSLLFRNRKLKDAASNLLRSVSELLKDETATFSMEDALRARQVLGKLRAAAKDPGLRRDLDAVVRQIELSKDRRLRAIIESLMSRKPGQRKRPSRAKKKPATRKPIRRPAKSARKSRKR